MQVNASSSMVDAAVMGLQLDELELASLRGEVQEVSLNLNFDTRMGAGQGECGRAPLQWAAGRSPQRWRAVGTGRHPLGEGCVAAANFQVPPVALCPLPSHP